MKLLLRLQVTVLELIMIMTITHQRAVVADMETDIIHQRQGKYNRYFYQKELFIDIFIESILIYYLF